MTRTTLLLRVALIAGFLVVWEFSSTFELVNPRLLPRLSDVLAAMVELWRNPQMVGNILLTMLTVAGSFLFSVLCGGALGIAIVANGFLRDVAHRPLFFLFGIPKSIFLPIFILSFGIGIDQKIIFGIFATVFFIIINVVAAFDSINRDFIVVARSFGASTFQTVRYVYGPSLRPQLIETARIALIFNIMGVLISEMYASRAGIGHYISAWGESYQMRELLAGVFTVSAFAIVFNEFLRWLESRWTYR